MSKHTPRKAFAPVADAPDPVTLPAMPQPEPPSAGALVAAPAVDAALPALIVEDEPSLTPYIDENGFDPADYDWVPVSRRPRKDGWSPAKQRLFIEILADTGCVATAAQEVGMAERNCYALRRAPGAESFAAAWDAAIQQASHRLVDLAFDRVIHGTDEPIFNKEGRRVGRRMRQDNRLLMFLLRAYQPDRFRHAHQSMRHPGEALPPPAVPMPQALARLEPVPSAEPHLTRSPEDLDVAVQVADLCEGRLPHWQRHAEADYDPDDAQSAGLGEKFERELEAIKEANARAAGWRPCSEEDDDLDD